MNITDKRFLVLFSIILIAWAIVYQEAILGMEAIWSRSDTFAHGYFILPISIWLLWRDKDNLLASKVSSTWLPLPVLAVSLFVWLFSYAADINVLGQLSAVVSLICLIWLMVGNKLAWRYKFPLAYLIFAVPMGENLIPWLQDVTAWFTVFFLKLNGIPVFVDGLYIQIPTGMFEVAVACSGIRYLIASIAVGTLFAYLTYHKTYKQIIFILFSIFLPILANGIRAYGIVAIAYYSDMKYATGVDHLVYGWLFFGVVIMLMFWIGGLFADPEKNQHKKVSTSNDMPLPQAGTVQPATALVLLVLTGYLVNQVDAALPPEKAQPALKATERLKQVQRSNWGIDFERPLQKSHLIHLDNFEVYRAVYAHRQSQGELISWSNVAYGSENWSVISTKKAFVGNTKAQSLLIRNASGEERTVIYWYEVAGSTFINKSKTKIWQAIEAYRTPDSTAEIMAFSMVNASEKQLINSIENFLPVLNQLKIATD